MKEEITSDMISQRSEKTFNIEASLASGASNVLDPSGQTNIKPDFKKKKNEALLVDNG